MQKFSSENKQIHAENSKEKISLMINGRQIYAEKNKTIIQIADENGIYIPRLCYHPYLANEKILSAKQVFRGEEKIIGEKNKEFNGCEICIVEINGKNFKSCETIVNGGEEIFTETEEVKKIREDNLAEILANHPHACLVCAQKEGCDRRTCTMNVLIEERCCDKFGNCELQKLAEYIGIKKETPKYIHKKLPKINNLPLISIDYNLCINCLRCIKICNLREVNALSFTIKDGKVFFGTSSKELKDDCKFCLSCIEICPTGTLIDKEKREIPCIVNCPAEIDVPNYVSLIAEGKFLESLEVIKEKVPFPNVLGRVCYKPCENFCKRGKLNESISICALKRFSAEYGEVEKEIGFDKQLLDKHETKLSENSQFSLNKIKEETLKKNSAEFDNKQLKREKIKQTGKKIAIIGSGPAGLTSAFYLAIKGHSVFVFEKENELGGMLRYGIPKYRLPNEILNKDLEEIKKSGIIFNTNTKINSFHDLKNFGDDSLFGFDAILISIGAQKSVKLNIEGKDFAIDGLEFLKEINKENKEFAKKFKGKKVAIIGGGNVAFDCAKVLVRLNALPTIFYRRSKAEMPAYIEEVENAEKEGVKVEYLQSPIKIQKISSDEKLKVEFVKMKLGEEENGRRRPIPIENSNFQLEFDFLISAIGQIPEDNFELKTEKECLFVDDNFSTSKKGVFACGDVLAPKTVINAIAQGRKSAIAIDKFLDGDGNIDEIKERDKKIKIGKEKNFFIAGREKIPCLTIEERLKGKTKKDEHKISLKDEKIPKDEEGICFAEVEKSYSKEQAIKEAKRCLQCNLRYEIQKQILPPEKFLILNGDNVNFVEEKEGVFELLNENKEVILIKGVENLRNGLKENFGKGKYFRYEFAPYYTKRESELIQQFLQKNGRMPKLNDELGDLF